MGDSDYGLALQGYAGSRPMWTLSVRSFASYGLSHVLHMQHHPFSSLEYEPTLPTKGPCLANSQKSGMIDRPNAAEKELSGVKGQMSLSSFG